MKKEISQYVAEFIVECSPEQESDLIEIPPDSKMGDYAIPCFPFAKLLHKSPAVIAEELKQLLPEWMIWGIMRVGERSLSMSVDQQEA